MVRNLANTCNISTFAGNNYGMLSKNNKMIKLDDACCIFALFFYPKVTLLTYVCFDCINSVSVLQLTFYFCTEIFNRLKKLTNHLL